MQVRTFSDEKDAPTDDSSNENVPEYVFDGFAADFSNKVALTSPASPTEDRKKAKASDG